MIDYLVLQSCQSGSCPQQVVSASYVMAPRVVAVAPVLPGKTKVITQYKRNLVGKLVPAYATVTTNAAVLEASEPKAAKGSACKGGCKN